MEGRTTRRGHLSALAKPLGPPAIHHQILKVVNYSFIGTDDSRFWGVRVADPRMRVADALRKRFIPPDPVVLATEWPAVHFTEFSYGLPCVFGSDR
ncbi:MAG: hypothetical protein IH987_21265 [Planctomycetes bacterium]|nr:hypothetical protein [Planctomycetota bacterium]